MVYYVVYEYETYLEDDPKHAWYVISSHSSRKEADEKALEINFAEFCEDKVFRWGSSKPSKTTNLTSKEKLKIVSNVLKNINDKTGSKNEYYGKGAFILSGDDFNPKNNVKHINDIAVYLSKEKREDYEAKCNEFDSEAEEEDEDNEEVCKDNEPSPKKEGLIENNDDDDTDEYHSEED